MFSQEDIKFISAVSGKTVDEISGAASSEKEVTLGLRLKDDGKIYTQQEIQAFQDLEEKGVQRGKQIGYKEIARSAGVELIEGEKKPDIVAEKIKLGIEGVYEEKYKNPEPGEELTKAIQKSTELENKYNALFETHNNALSQLETEKENVNNIMSKHLDEKINMAVIANLPEKIKEDRTDALFITRRDLNFQFDKESDKIITKEGDKIVTNGYGDPEELDKVLKGYSEKKGWFGQEGMNGGDRSGNGHENPTFNTSEEAVAYIKSQKIDPMSTDGLKLMREITN